jgi:hypothetical protein
MTRRVLSVLLMVGVLVAASHASAACRRIGTQLDCDLAARQLVIGTQAADASTHSRSLAPEPLHGTDPVPANHAAPAPSFVLELQDIDSGTSLCRDTENERYCD